MNVYNLMWYASNLHMALCPRSVSPPQKKNKFDLTEKSENICLSLHVMFNVHGCVHF